MLAGSSYWVPGSWVFNFEFFFSELEIRNGNQSTTRTKTGNWLPIRTGLRTRTDPKTHSMQFLVLHFLKLKIKNSSFKVVFFPFLTQVRHVISLRKKVGFGIITAPIF
jgi:hypothetical protein